MFCSDATILGGRIRYFFEYTVVNLPDIDFFTTVNILKIAEINNY